MTDNIVTRVDITDEQVKILCDCFNVDYSTCEEYQVGELVNKLIDKFNRRKIN